DVALKSGSNLPGSNIVVRNNLFSTGGYTDAPFFWDFTAINFMLCNHKLTDASQTAAMATCPAGVFSHNLIPGVTLASTPGPDGTCMTQDTKRKGSGIYG